MKSSLSFVAISLSLLACGGELSNRGQSKGSAAGNEALGISSAGAQTIINNAAELSEMARNLKADLLSAANRCKALDTKIKAFVSSNTDVSSDLAADKNALATKKAELQPILEMLITKRAALADTAGNLASVKLQLDNFGKDKKAAVEKAIADLTTQKEALTKEIASLERQIIQANNAYDKEFANDSRNFDKLLELQGKVTDLHIKQDQAKADLAEVVASINQITQDTKSAQNTSKAALETKLAELQKTNSELKSAIADLLKQIEAMLKAINNLQVKIDRAERVAGLKVATLPESCKPFLATDE